MDIPFQMQVCNQAATTLLGDLYNEGIINEKQYKAARQYSIIIAKRSMLGVWWDRLWKKNPDSYQIMIVKVLLKVDGDDNNQGGNKDPKLGSPVKSGDFKPASLN